MDYCKFVPRIRIFALCAILGIVGWPSIARMVRGQILSLREQEFMVATEATGVRVSRRIFRHLIPNVIPQLIVIATMGLGDVILMEATLSFLGIGVKFPYASWGNIVNAVNDVYVPVSYTHLRAHETGRNLVCRLLLEKKKKQKHKKLGWLVLNLKERANV